MSEKITSEPLSRRKVFSLLGLGAALSLAVPTLLVVSDAEAQTEGMERREERREHRRGRREERREHRRGRREERREYREERREHRREYRTERRERRHHKPAAAPATPPAQ